MHEQSLMADLMRQLIGIAQKEKAAVIVGVKVKIGALAHISAEHFREHFVEAAKGTCAEGAELDVVSLDDIEDPQAQEIILDSVELEG